LTGASLALQPPDNIEALRQMSAACALRPNSSILQTNLGLAYARLGSHDLALNAYRRAIALSPNNQLAHMWIGRASMARSDWNAAIAALREFIRLSTDIQSDHGRHSAHRGHLELSIALAGAGRYEEAVDACREAIRLKPDEPAPYLRLGAIHPWVGGQPP